MSEALGQDIAHADRTVVATTKPNGQRYVPGGLPSVFDADKMAFLMASDYAVMMTGAVATMNCRRARPHGSGRGDRESQGGTMQKITPCLWFDDNAEDAVNFYVSIFKDSRIVHVARYGEAGAKASGRPEGTVMTMAFELEGQGFVALNGGPSFTFSPAISLVVNCSAQDELDTLWDKLSAGGQTQQCGWLTDRFGVSWQIVPAMLSEMLQDEDARKSERVMAALLAMDKLDIAGLQQAYAQR